MAKKTSKKCPKTNPAAAAVTTSSMLECLRTKPADALISAASDVTPDTPSPFTVVAVSDDMPRFDEFSSNRISSVLLGSNGDEGSVLASHLMPLIFDSSLNGRIHDEWMTREVLADALVKTLPGGTPNEVRH